MVVAVSTAVALVVSAVALWLPDMLEAESEVGGVESASADRTSQVGFQTLPAQDRGSLHSGDPHSGNQLMKDALIDPCLPTSRIIAARCLLPRVHHKQSPNAD
jgi:hypothetical protein